jgi:hypothetical protein
MLQRSSFARGWMPDADAVNAPVDGLLRMDNLTLDELGVVAVRPGSAKLYGPLADLDVHSLFTGILSGSRYRMAGAGSTVYANGSSLSTGIAGSGDIQFGSHLGQILFARSTTKKKWDGTTLRTWGIAQTGGTPTAAAVAADKKVFATCDLAEAPAFSYEEDDGTGAAFATGVDGTGNGSILLNTNATTSRGSITKLYAGATDFTSYDSGTAGTDDDLIQVYVYITDPTALLSFRLMVDVSGGDFTADYYFHDYTTTDEPTLTPRAGTALPISTGLQATDGARVRGSLPAIGTALPRAGLRVDKPVVNAGWSRLLVRRGDMTRFGSSSAKDWKTVRAIRLVVQATAMNTVAIDDIRIISNAVVGRYKWAYVHVYNNGTYQAKSAPSALSAETQMQSQGATITVPADASRDSQINETWLFRGGGAMDSFYRVAVKTSVSGVGSFTISDALSDIDAMTVNIKLETDNAPPPDTIIDIEGPYYDRVFALTATHLYPSRRLNPDSFASGQVVRVSGADETALWVKKALGGLYIGTTKEIYRLDGTGAELPDGTIDFTKTPLNIDHPPVADGVAQDGNLLIYLADDGWRTLGGGGSSPIAGDTSLLYQGKTRHGVSPVNLTSGRFRAAIWKGQFVALTPEGSSTTSSTVLYRHVPQRGGWQRHVYASAFRCVYREPDGTLLASDAAGYLWQLGTGTQDDGADIPITIWTKIDDDGQPFNRKDPIDLRLHLDTGGAVLTAAVYLDGSETAALSTTATQSTVGITAASLEDVAAFRQMQLRLTASVSVFRLVGFGVQYTPLPVPVRGILTPTNLDDPRIKTLSGFQIRVGTFGLARTLTPDRRRRRTAGTIGHERRGRSGDRHVPVHRAGDGNRCHLGVRWRRRNLRDDAAGDGAAAARRQELGQRADRFGAQRIDLAARDPAESEGRRRSADYAVLRCDRLSDRHRADRRDRHQRVDGVHGVDAAQLSRPRAAARHHEQRTVLPVLAAAGASAVGLDYRQAIPADSDRR